MRVIDAFTGRELSVGDFVPTDTPDIYDGYYKVVAIKPGIFHASMLVESNVPTLHGKWLPLAVRWTHPNFFLQHVAFVPS